MCFQAIFTSETPLSMTVMTMVTVFSPVGVGIVITVTIVISVILLLASHPLFS